MIRIWAAVLAVALAATIGHADPLMPEVAGPPAAPPTRTDDQARHARRRIAVIIGSVGTASVLIGALHAIGSIEDRRDADALCHPTCNDTGTYLSDRAHGLARGAEIMIGSGLAVVGLGLAVWATAPGVRVVPVVTPTTASAMLVGHF